MANSRFYTTDKTNETELVSFSSAARRILLAFEQNEQLAVFPFSVVLS